MYKPIVCIGKNNMLSLERRETVHVSPKDQLPANTGIFPREVIDSPRFAEYLAPAESISHHTGLHLINTRLWIEELSEKYQRKITVGTVPDTEWSTLFQKYDTFWFMGIYTPSEMSRQHAVQYADTVRYAKPDLDPKKDIVGSPFAIPSYEPNPEIAADWNEWDEMVEKLYAHDKKVVIDFVPNHLARDHRFVQERPGYFIQGTEDDFLANPRDFKKICNDEGTYYIAHGKDPNFDSWEDTFQLNYANPAVQQMMQDVVLDLVDHADGIRCDMAMLVNPRTFLQTWGSRLTGEEQAYLKGNSFWHKTISLAKLKAAKEYQREFLFIGEVYWDKDILGECFDYIYAKDYYDHLRSVIVDGKSSGDALRAHIQYLLEAKQRHEHYRDIIFTENHDEERAVHTFGKEYSKAAALLAGLIPEAIFMLNQGQEQGKRIRPPMQLGRFPDEAVFPDIIEFYQRFIGLRRTRLYQEGAKNMKLTEIKRNSDGIIALQFYVNDANGDQIGAIVCVNVERSYASGNIPEIGKGESAVVWKIYEGIVEEKADQERAEGIYVGLLPGESQIIFYHKKHEVTPQEHILYQAA